MRKKITIIAVLFSCLTSVSAQTFTLGITGNSGCGCSSSCNPAVCSPTASGPCPVETVSAPPVLVPANSNVRVQIISLGSPSCISGGGGLDIADELLVNGVAVFTGSNAAVNFDQCYSSGNSNTSIIISLTANRRDEQVSITLTTSPGSGAGCTALPPPLRISLSSFTAQRLNNNAILLNWITVSETENKFMAVERSLNGTDFSEIGRINGNGTTVISHNYTFQDYSAPLQPVYYRLRIVNFNDVITYSNILLVKNNSLNEAVTIYPNPIDDIIGVTAVNKMKQITVFDAHGKRVLTKETGNATAQQINVHMLSSGIYVVKINMNNGETIFQKLIKK